jgi:hypothetical protein
VIILFFVAVIASPSVFADGADAELHDVDVTASPSSQGSGGVIIVDAAVYFFGGCCYHLYANDVMATLEVPEGLEIIDGPTPEKYDEVDAQPGGTATVVHFKWSVRGNTIGAYNMTVMIDTKNCGNMENQVNVEIVEGCIISHPIIYPEEPQVGRENMIFVSASTSLEGRYVEKVTLFYVMGEEYSEGEPKNDTLYLNDGGEVKGTAIELEQDPYLPEQWMCKLEIKNQDKINFWFVAMDDMGENTTSSLYPKEIVDREAIDSLVGTTFWILFLVIIIGLVLIFMIYYIYMTRREGPKNILKLRAEVEGEGKVSTLQNIITIAFLVISLVIIILAIIFGWFEEIIELSMG